MAYCKANQLDCNGFCNRFDAPCIKKNCRFFGVKTNADRIRAMSDEELAHWICKKMTSCSRNVCPGADLCQSGDGLANGLVKWLKQPVDVDNKHKHFPNGDCK